MGEKFPPFCAEYIITPVLLTFDIPYLPEYTNPGSIQYRVLENDVKEAVRYKFQISKLLLV